MKKIRIISVTLCLIMLLLCLCSCSSTDTTFTPQARVNMNYNNISAGNSPIWVTDDALYFTTANFIQMVTPNGSEQTFETDNTQILPMQIVNDSVYLLTYSYDEYIFEYDYFVEEYTTDGTYIKSYYLETTEEYVGYQSFYVLNGIVYLLTDEMTVKAFDLAEEGKCRTVEDRIISCGVSDGRFCYVTRTKNYNSSSGDGYTISVYSYNGKTGKAVELAHMSGSGNTDYTTYYRANFTDDYAILLNYQESKALCLLLVFDLKTMQYKSVALDGINVSEVVAYDNSVFIVEEGISTEDEHSRIYRYKIKEQKLEKLCLVDAETINLFVTSDKDIYVYSYNYDGVLYINADKNTQKQVIEYGFLRGIFKITVPVTE